MINKSIKKKYHKVIPQLFEAVGEVYADYWNDFFHFAIFEDENWTFDQAFEHTHNSYMQAVNVREAKHILVLACGRGGFSNIIAQNTSGQVLGVDISPAQLRQANRFQRNNLRFKQHDIMKIDELDTTFDAVIFLDAACYLPNKKKALKKIHSVMNPGGKLLLVDWCKKVGLNYIQEELALHPFMNYWAIPSLETKKSWVKHFKRLGYQLHEMEDLNDKAEKNWQYSYENGLDGLKRFKISDIPKMLLDGSRAGPSSVRMIKEQFPALLYIKAAFDAGFLRYARFLVEK